MSTQPFKRKPINKKGLRNLHFQARLFDGNPGEKEAIDAYRAIAAAEFDMPGGKRKLTVREIGREALLALYEKLSGGYRPTTWQAASNEADITRLTRAVEALLNQLASGQGITLQQRDEIDDQIQRINIARNTASLAGGLTTFEAEDDEEW